MKKFIVLLLALLLLISASACSNKKNTKDNKDTSAKETVISDSDNDPDTENNDPKPSDSEESRNDAFVNPEDVEEYIPNAEIETPHVEFKYYDEWNENVRFETVEADNGNYEVRCYGVNAIKDIHCFSIIFGNSEEEADHYNIGTLTKDGNTVNVYTYVNQNFEQLSEEQISIINDTVLTYYMNDLTYQLKDVDGFAVSR
ncbi:MAG: hypothetical protein E7591_10175 [Ruminococcaceae bacterium]|nr:hypothetical protein [Oscillospiraceae bacterium]